MVLLTGEWLRIQSVSRSLIERSEGTEDEKILSSKTEQDFQKFFRQEILLQIGSSWCMSYLKSNHIFELVYL